MTNKNNQSDKNLNSKTFYNSKFKNFELISEFNNSNVEEITKIVDDNRPYLKVRINDREFMGLMDSGAQITIAGNGVEEKLIELGLEVTTINTGNILLADGKPKPVTGIIRIPFQYNNCIKTISALIVPSIVRDFNFGYDFWEAFGFIPKRDDNVIRLSDYKEAEREVYESSESLDIDDVENSWKELTNEEKSQLEEIIKKFDATTDKFLGKTNLMEHTIDTGNNPPVRCRQYRFSPYKLEMINKEVDRLLEMGIIKECEFSEWSNPIIVVIKPDGSIRLCIDARKLNAITSVDAMAIQDINRIFQNFPQARYYSKIDLSQAFNQIPLSEDSMPKTAFEIPGRGFFMFTVTPFGVKNGPSKLCRLLRKVLPHSLEPEVFVFCDDVIVRAKTIKRMMELLKIIADRFKQAGLTINKKKSLFCVKKLKFLGNILSEDGWEIDEDRKKAILNYPEPKSLKETRRLLGMINFFRNYIPNISDILAPISDMTKVSRKMKEEKSKFVFSDKAREAFEKLKQILTREPVMLYFPDYTVPFRIHTDSSGVAGSGVLTQIVDNKERVISYFSKKYSKQQRKYSSNEKELLAVMLSLEKFRPYVLGTQFQVITDNMAVAWLLSLKIESKGKLGRWVSKLSEYNIDFVHRAGKDHVLPDALSRAVEEIQSQNNYLLDPDYLNQFLRISSEPEKFKDYRIKDEKIYKLVKTKNNRAVDPELLWKELIPESYINEILKENHDSIGHQGCFKTFNRIKNKYYIPKLYFIVGNYIKNCEKCKASKASNTINKKPMGAPKIANRNFELISLDFMGPLPRTKKGNTALLVINDWFSKFAILHPMTSQDSSRLVDYLEHEVFPIFGVPAKILSDNGKQFISKQFKDLLERKGIEHHLTANYHPQVNPTERTNRVIGDILRTYVDNDHRSWDNYVGTIQSAINSSVNESTNFSPHFTMFNSEMILNGRDHHHKNLNNDLNNENNVKVDPPDRDEVFEQVKDNIKKAYEKNKKNYNLRTRPHKFNLNEIVWKTNFVLSNKAENFSSKLAPKKIKCKIISIKGSNTYELVDMKGKNLGFYSGNQLSK